MKMETNKYFDKVITRYDKYSFLSSNSDLKNHLSKLMEFNDIDYVLDVGTGTGNFACLCTNLASHVVGIDINMQMLMRSRLKSITPIMGEAYRLPFKKETFDLVL